MKTNNLLRVFLASILLLALAACDTADQNPPDQKPPEEDPPAHSTIDLKPAAALAIGEIDAPTVSYSLQNTMSAVVAVHDDGTINVLQQDDTFFHDFRIINGRVFLDPIDPWSYGCALVEVVNDTELECVDAYMHSFAEIQVGSDGTLYYRGFALTNDGHDLVEVLRKRTPGSEAEQVFDLSGPLDLRSWVVATDDRVYLSGLNHALDEYWFRRLNDDGSLTNIALPAENHGFKFVGTWPDGKLYALEDRNQTIWRFTPGPGEIQPEPYLGFRDRVEDVLYDWRESGIDQPMLFMSQNVRLHTRSGRILYDFLDGASTQVGELYPDPKLFEPDLDRIVDGQFHNNGNYYFTGRLHNRKFGIVALDTATGTQATSYETDLEMLNNFINTDASQAFFNAFDDTQNRYVMAVADLATGETTVEPLTTTLTKLQPLY